MPDNTIDGRSGASIGQVANNPLELSNSDWNAHVSDMSNNELLGDMSCCSMLSFENKSRFGMSVVTAASNVLAQAAAVDQAM